MGGIGLRGRRDAGAPRRSTLLPIIALLVVGADQAVKAAVRAQVPIGQPRPLIEGVLWLTHVENTGGAFSILSGRQWLFMIAPSVVIVVVLALWALDKLERIHAVSLGLVIGGAAGNLVDRVRFGRVTDFLDVGFWPVFNVADMAIVVGVCVFAAWTILWQRDVQLEAEVEEADAESIYGDAGLCPGTSEAEGGDTGGPREDS